LPIYIVDGDDAPIGLAKAADGKEGRGHLEIRLLKSATAAITSNVKATRMVEAAAITGVRSCLSAPQMRTGRVCRSGLAMKIATTTSSQEIRKANTAAEKSPMRMAGSVIFSFACRGEAPQRTAASSIDLSKPSSELTIGITAKGKASTVWASTKPTRVPFRPTRRNSA